MVRRADCGANNATSVNRYGDDANGMSCIASDCAMWVSDGLEQIDGADYEIGHCGLIK